MRSSWASSHPDCWMVQVYARITPNSARIAQYSRKLKIDCVQAGGQLFCTTNGQAIRPAKKYSSACVGWADVFAMWLPF